MQVLEILEYAASAQWGMISTAQAQREGVSRGQLSRLAARGTLQRARQGVYLLPSASYGSATELKAAWVALDPAHYPDERWSSGPVVVSHESAAAVHDIGTLIPQRHTFSSRARKQTTHADIRVHRTRDLLPEECVNVAGLPVTTVERTVADLAAKGIERGYLASLAVDSLRKEGVCFKSLAARLDAYSRFYGADDGQSLLHTFQDEMGSEEDRNDLIDRLRIVPQVVDALGDMVQQISRMTEISTETLLRELPANLAAKDKRS